MKLHYAMIGGGRGAFIGAVHRIAAALDGQAELAAGALSIDPQEAIDSGVDLGLDPSRTHRTWQDLLAAEKALPPGRRVAWVSIVTPNHVHYEIARAFVDAGFNVVCEKPMVTTGSQAADLIRAVDLAGVVFAVTYNYSGYPMVKQAAALVRAGEIGDVRKVFVEYHQGWLATKLEAQGQPQASWRTDPSKAGLGGAIGDIGSHAENLVSTITGLEIDEIAAELTAMVPGRALDDDAAVLIRFKGGARGVLTASQICVGEENNLSIRVYGTRGGLHWRQEDPNRLVVTALSAPARVFTRGGPALNEAATRASRIPSGHPEGFFEAFANVYRGVVGAIRAKQNGTPADGLAKEFPTVHDGARGVWFIEHCVRSSREHAGAWIPFRPPT